MTIPQPVSWQSIQTEVLRRIHEREWPPGHVIPGEVDLAAEFGCARATVNRALRSLAETGILERRRKAGTRVALHPVSRATLDIPILRQEIEERGHSYGYTLFKRGEVRPPKSLRPMLGPSALRVTAIHLADERPFVLEDRWINLTAVGSARDQPFETVSANEWLLQTVPYTHGEISFAAIAAKKMTSERLGTYEGAPIFVIERATWDHDQMVTCVHLSYAPGYQIKTVLGG